MERGRNLIKLRPEIPQADVNGTMTEIEQFQNTTLRPILKFQNDLLSIHFSQFARSYKKDWGSISNEKKNRFYRKFNDEKPRIKKYNCWDDNWII